ncbi:PH domain-containing protein [uncultured Cardiobacterium sp.]|uniref:PH domain-containing protein n=1 Tax=uncultured Cardiobacterium sp. TaxID=417619 RepID=UPI00261FCCFF|nr:PH domain-containing protein [uncultured Cardiobacterium sp.]
MHNVTLTRSLTHRLLGVAEVTLETGGSGETAEARLRVLSLADARLFEELVLRETPPEAADDNLLPLDNRALLRYGLLNDFGVLVGGSFALLAMLPDANSPDWMTALMQWLFKRLLPDDWYHSGASWLLVLVLALLLGKLTMLAGAFFRYSHFYLGERDGLLTQRRGLFARVESHMPLARIQVWRVQQSPLYRLCGLYAVAIDTVVVPGKQGERGIRELLPLADAATLSRLLARWAGCDPLAVPLNPIHPQAARRLFRRYALWLAFWITVALCFARLFAAQMWLMTLPLLWLASLPSLHLAATRRCRHAAWAFNNGFLHRRDGWLWRTHCFAAADKVQALQLTESPFDRRYGMANVTADTMGTGLSMPLALPWLAKEDAMRLLHELTGAAKARG